MDPTRGVVHNGSLQSLCQPDRGHNQKRFNGPRAGSIFDSVLRCVPPGVHLPTGTGSNQLQELAMVYDGL